ncbi:hypothetical protein [Sphingomonas sp.]|uniref:hypothetical protein n=1 Tax=Sphingomonas sp. TaxID=28214 RepID=UPI00286D8D21|nr:hypothetical protein [Sphingomonas sp.]
MRPEMIFPTLLGMAVFLGLMAWIIQANAAMWRKVAAQYHGDNRSPILTTKSIETVVVTERKDGSRLAINAFRNYAGVRMVLRRDGLALSILPPLNISTPPLFLPFDEMELKETSWALWPQPYAIRMRRAPGLDLIVDRGVARWIRDHAERPAL